MSLTRYMQFQRALNPVLASKTKLELLRTMFGSPGQRWTGRELARSAGVSTAQAARDLAELADTSVVLREVVGRSYSWRLNSFHVLFATLTGLFVQEASLRSELLHDLSDELRHARPERARLFGSVSRGEERPDSDVDLFVQVRTPADRLEVEEAVRRIRARVWDRFGNPVSSLVYTRAELARTRNPALLESIEREGVEVETGAR